MTSFSSIVLFPICFLLQGVGSRHKPQREKAIPDEITYAGQRGTVIPLYTSGVLTTRFFYVSHYTPERSSLCSVKTSPLTLHTKLYAHDKQAFFIFFTFTHTQTHQKKAIERPSPFRRSHLHKLPQMSPGQISHT